MLTHEATTPALVLVSHHWTSRPGLQAPLGRERLAHCAFHVPVDGALVSMCEVNALGIRERHHASPGTVRRA